MYEAAEIAKLVADGNSTALFGLLQNNMAPILGKRMFTCSVFDLANEKSIRIFSSHPDDYPVSGQKPIKPNRWTKIVFDEKRNFISNRPEEFRDVFGDHEKIVGMKGGSVVNLRIVCNRELLGTVNLTDDRDAATPEAINTASQYLWLAQTCFLVQRQQCKD